ncbi:ClpP family protease [Candidatus Poriferisodalis sp.]|uniref:ClpP family protease n=1 Tax=Candidatus Poriferisodalis sp. TaxID=3101277 RepID=UPI003AF9D7AF
MSFHASESQHSGRSRAFAFSGQANQRERAHGPYLWPSEEDPSWLFADDSITLGKPRRRLDQLASERSHELDSRLIKENIIFLGTYIDDVIANRVCAQMIHLEWENPDKDINIYINSPGGDVSSLFTIYDTSQSVRNDIMTVCLEEASGAAAVLLAAGTPGKRMALPNARVLLSQPYGSAMGQAADIELRAREIDQLRQRIERITAYHTGQHPERIRADTERDFIMDAEAAKKYGVIDQVIASR